MAELNTFRELTDAEIDMVSGGSSEVHHSDRDGY